MDGAGAPSLGIGCKEYEYKGQGGGADQMNSYIQHQLLITIGFSRWTIFKPGDVQNLKVQKNMNYL